MAAVPVADNPAFRSTNSNESRKLRQDQGNLPEAYADMQRNAEAPRSRAAAEPNALGNINAYFGARGPQIPLDKTIPLG